MAENYNDLDRYQDILGQLPMIQVYSHILYFFPQPEASREVIVKRLGDAITKVRDQVPWMGARVVNVGKGPGSSGTYRVASCPRPPQPIVVRDVSKSVPTYADLASRKAALSMLDPAELTSVSAFPERFEDSEADPAHVVRMQVSFIEGGIIIDFVMHHNMADAGGHFGFVKMIAMAMRGEDFSPALLREANRDRRNLFPLLGPDEPMLDHSHHKRKPVATAGLIADKGPGSAQPVPARHHIFRFTDAKMEKLKALARPTADDGDVKFISTDDAISAFIWQRVIKTRLAANLKDHRLDTRSRFARAIDGRGALGLSPDYMGDVIHNVTTFLTLGDLASKPLSAVAAQLRRRLNECNTAYHVRSFATFVANEPDKSTIMYGGEFNPAVDIGCSSIRGRKDLFADFGELGRPTLIRRPPPPPFPGLLVLFPGTERGDCDAMLCITDEDFERLGKDPEWTEYVEYIG